MPKFPHVTVELVGEDGNAFAILGRVSRAMRKGGCTKQEVEEFMNTATAGDYDHLLRTAIETVNVE